MFLIHINAVINRIIRDVFVDPGVSDCTIKATVVLSEELEMVRDQVT